MTQGELAIFTGRLWTVKVTYQNLTRYRGALVREQARETLKVKADSPEAARKEVRRILGDRFVAIYEPIYKSSQGLEAIQPGGIKIPLPKTLNIKEVI